MTASPHSQSRDRRWLYVFIMASVLAIGVAAVSFTTNRSVVVKPPQVKTKTVICKPGDQRCLKTIQRESNQTVKAVDSQSESIAAAVGGDGPPGERGPQGLEGLIGPIGIPGDNGSSGSAGPVGSPGTNGEQGAKGDAGTNGSDGLNGANGADGLPGQDGAQGPPGPQGPPGADGTSYVCNPGTITDGNGQPVSVCVP